MCSPLRLQRHHPCRREEPNQLLSLEEMGRADEKIGDQEEHQKEMAPIDLSNLTVIKEGEAEILMNAGNEVFYNKSQVC